MKLSVKTITNTDAGFVSLPTQFMEPLREDLITRCVLALQAGRRQAYGGYGQAGTRHSADLSKRRRAYRGTYGRGQSRVPRKVHSRRGTQFHYVGAIVAGTVGGRRAHGPTPVKKWTQKVNKIENRKAIRSALAATMVSELVTGRGHKVPTGFPFIIDNAFENLKKTKDVEAALVHLGFAAELERGAEKRIRAGKGKMRGRKYKRPTSILFVVGKDDTELSQASSNVPGTDVIPVQNLNAELLAPGAQPGRLTLFTQSAIERLEKEELFTQHYKGPKVDKTVKTPVVKKSSEKKVEKKEVPVKKEVKDTPVVFEKKAPVKAETPKVEVVA